MGKLWQLFSYATKANYYEKMKYIKGVVIIYICRCYQDEEKVWFLILAIKEKTFLLKILIKKKEFNNLNKFPIFLKLV